MKIEKVNVLVSKVDIKKSSKGESYLAIDFLDLASGDNFNVITKEIELMSKLQMMNKYTIDFNLTSSKYGLKLEIESVGKSLGGI